MVVASSGCGTTFRKARPDLPDSERDAVELAALHDEFDLALEERRFDDAEAIIVELEEGVEAADRSLVLHRTYPVLSAQLVRAPKRLAAAKRTANVETRVADTQSLLNEIREVRENLEVNGGSPGDLDTLEDLKDELEDRLEDNVGVQKDRRYRDLDAEARTELLELADVTPTYRWQRESSERLNETLEELPDLPEDVNREALLSAAEQSEARRDTLNECARVADELNGETGAADEAPIAMTLTVAPLHDIQALCAAEAEDAAANALRLRWRNKTHETYDAITRALLAIEASTNKRESLAAHQSAVDAMRACPDELDAGSPGYDPSALFPGHMGKKSAPRLSEACVKVIGNIEGKLPLLRWQAELETHGAAYSHAIDELETAKSLEDADEKREVLTGLLAGLETCQSRAGALALAQEAQWTGARLKRSNKRAAAKLEKRCRLLQPQIRKLLP
ncbi:MAG: hypothetical protein AAFQ82_15620 [Myxococcota bacterium]